MWSDLEVKREFQSMVHFGSIPVGAIRYCELPKLVVDTCSGQFYPKTKKHWIPIKLNVVNLVEPNITQMVLDMIDKCAVHQLLIETIDGSGNVIETWTLDNAQIFDAKFGCYESSETQPCELELSIGYEDAIFEIVKKS
jgi:hypothetical protein